MAEQQSYNYIDIQRYLERQMTPQEMHAFERAMLDDPFLADALEGYEAADTNVSSKHLSSIEKNIRGNEQAKVIALPRQKNRWFAAAAAILVILTGGVLTYQLTRTTALVTAPQVAEVKQTEATKQADTLKATESIGADIAANNVDLKNSLGKPPSTTPNVQQQAVAGNGSYADAGIGDTTVIVMNSLPIRREKAKAEEQQQMAEARSAKDFARDEQKQMSKAMATAAPSAAHEFVGKVVDESGDPMPFASIKATNSNTGTVTDAQGRFVLRAPDSVLNINVQSVGYATASVQIKSNNSQDVVLKEDNSNLSEVVVTGLSKKRQLAAKAANADSTMPAGGWNNFNKYVNARIDSLKATSKYNFNNRDIDLEFNIDKQGRPTHITVPADAEKVIAEQAIDIIRQGPTWTKPSKKKKKVKVTLKF
jgi:hypothetical protein